MKKFFVLIVFSICVRCLSSEKFKAIVNHNRYSPSDSFDDSYRKKNNILSLFTAYVGADMYELQQLLKKNGWALIYASNEKGIDLVPYKSI